MADGAGHVYVCAALGGGRAITPQGRYAALRVRMPSRA